MRASSGSASASPSSAQTAPRPGAGGGGEALISGEGLAKSFGMEVLFEGLDVTISRGQKMGLLGRNGCGKSTLLRILAGMEAPDKGKVQRRRQLNLGFLAQDPELPGDSTLLDAVLSADNAAMRAVREYERAAQRMKGRDPTPAMIAALQKAMDGVEAMGAWDVVADAEKLLEILGLGDVAAGNSGGEDGVGFTERRVSSLSGGQRKRVALAAVLLAKPDLIILDEPTNHMDVAVIDWMQSALSNPSLTVILVSHDRYFLDAVCTQMLEIDRGSSFRHSGNYSDFLAARAKRAVEEAAAIGRAANTLRREGEWMSRMPKARSTKSRSRIDRFLTLTKATAEKRQRQQQQSVGSVVEMGVGEARLGGKILELQDATAGRGGKTVFEGFTYEFGRGDRLGVVGRNGSGKTTFLDSIAGLLPLSSGMRDIGETVVMGYYTQHMPPIPDNMRVLEFVQNFDPMAAMLVSSGLSNPAAAAAAGSVGGGAAAGAVGGGAASGSDGSGSAEALSATDLLTRFGFPRAKQFAWASKLSGGEKRRLLLAAVLAQRPNFLLLDEPTNDLDLQTVEALETFLAAYEGCLLVASHDRAFMDAVVDRQFVLQGDGQVALFDGLFSEYLVDSKEQQKDRAAEEERERAAGEERRKEVEATRLAEERKQKEGAGAGAGVGSGGSSGGGSGGVTAGKAVKGGKSARKMSYMERKEWERLEQEIEKLEKKKAVVEARLEEKSKQGDFEVLQGLSDELASMAKAIEAKSDRWLELAELAEE